MSLDISLMKMKPVEVYDANITHNLIDMAKAVGIYRHLWRPEDLGITHAHELISPLELGLEELRLHPNKYKKYNPPNGWGTYENFVKFVENYLEACKDNPDSFVHVSR